MERTGDNTGSSRRAPVSAGRSSPGRWADPRGPIPFTDERREVSPMAAKVLEDWTYGDRLIILVDSEESGGELFRFEYVARAVTTSPPDHVHKEQEERVQVVEGKVSCRLAGVERDLGPGDTL